MTAAHPYNLQIQGAGEMLPRADEVFMCIRHESEGRDSFYLSENTLVYAGAGRLEVEIEEGESVILDKGECVFIRKEHHISLINRRYTEIPYHLTVLLLLPRQLLFDYYRTLRSTDLPEKVVRSDKAFLRIPRSSLLSSLFHSFRPFWENGDLPEKHWLRIKVLEAIRFLLLTDKSVYMTLFDFASPWRGDLLQFMEQNFRYDLTVEEMAAYTGRSLSTFKREFKRLSALSPANWIIHRKLQESHTLLTTTDWPIYRIMSHVGFKNFSHFSRRYRLLFGESPTQTRFNLSRTAQSFEPYSTIEHPTHSV